MPSHPLRPFLPRRVARLAALAFCLAAALLHGCLNEGAMGKDRGGGTEIPNEVRGTLRTLAGLPAVGAEVALIPAGYVPDSAPASGKLSALTDSAGRYAFTGVPDGYYNAVFAAALGGDDAGHAAFRDSIRLVNGGVDGGTGAAAALSDTLRPPGHLTTLVKLRPEDAQRTVLVQVLGTPFFRKGTASQPLELALPQGEFDVRVSVDIPAVDPVSESVSLASGTSDTLKVTFPTYLYPVIW